MSLRFASRAVMVARSVHLLSFRRVTPSPSGRVVLPRCCGVTAAAIAPGFTLLELTTVLLVIAILAVTALPVVRNLQGRAQVVRCTENLRNLHVGANLYVQEHNGWPQIAAPRSPRDPQYAAAWQDALRPYGVTSQVWVCPTVQRLAGNPDLSAPDNQRVDYTAMPFDRRPRAPYRHGNMPWFVETSSVHGGGQLIIFADGSVRGTREVAVTAASAAAGTK